MKKNKIYIVNKRTGKVVHKEDLGDESEEGLVPIKRVVLEKKSKSFCSSDFDYKIPINFEIKGNNLVRIHLVTIQIDKNDSLFIDQTFAMNHYGGEGWLARKEKDCSKMLGDKSPCSSKMTLIISNP